MANSSSGSNDTNNLFVSLQTGIEPPPPTPIHGAMLFHGQNPTRGGEVPSSSSSGSDFVEDLDLNAANISQPAGASTNTQVTEESKMLHDQQEFDAQMQAFVDLTNKSKKGLGESKWATKPAENNKDKENNRNAWAAAVLFNDKKRDFAVASTSVPAQMLPQCAKTSPTPSSPNTEPFPPFVDDFEGSDNGERTVQHETVDMLGFDQTEKDLEKPISNENREQAVFFSSWGAPTARNTSTPQVRKVFLRGLPPKAENSLIPLLIHGGAIDEFKVIRPSAADGLCSATIYFTNGQAACNYVQKYPFGFSFKYQDKQFSVTVALATQVDIISSVKRAQLENRFSRIVRATGVDADWSIAALRAVAGRRGGVLEKIEDVWREDVRTVVFSFTSISDANIFKGLMVRNEDFETCNIQFVDDVCEKATGLRV